jgi:DNA ligase-1
MHISVSVTVSPVSNAARGLISAERGLSLRFPRFIRLREDKHLEQASTPEFLAGIYRAQRARGTNTKGADDGDLIDIELQESEMDENEDDEEEGEEEEEEERGA